VTEELDRGNEGCVLYIMKGKLKVKKKPLFVATMYNDYFFIMYTDKKAIQKEEKEDKKKDE
jgi:hypothetical protein